MQQGRSGEQLWQLFIRPLVCLFACLYVRLKHKSLLAQRELLKLENLINKLREWLIKIRIKGFAINFSTATFSNNFSCANSLLCSAVRIGAAQPPKTNESEMIILKIFLSPRKFLRLSEKKLQSSFPTHIYPLGQPSRISSELILGRKPRTQMGVVLFCFGLFHYGFFEFDGSFKKEKF